jgi:hypothetical protein
MKISPRKRGGRDSVVGIAIRYGLDGPGFKPRWGQLFHQPFRSALKPTQFLIQRKPDLFHGDKAAGSWINYPPPSNIVVNERVEPYFHSTSGLSCYDTEQILPFFILFTTWTISTLPNTLGVTEWVISRFSVKYALRPKNIQHSTQRHGMFSVR